MVRHYSPEFFESYPDIKFRMCYYARLFVAKPRQNTIITAKNDTMAPTFSPSWTPRRPELAPADATNARVGARNLRGGRQRVGRRRYEVRGRPNRRRTARVATARQR